MQQVVLQQPGRLVLGDGPDPVAGPGEAIIRVRRIGVCGTDLHAYTGKHPFIQYPRILGHEVAAEVLEAPPNDAGIRAGDRCSLRPYVACGRCHACMQGKSNCCHSMSVIGVHSDGCMRPRVAVPVTHLHKSKRLSLDQLALIEPLSIGLHAVHRGQAAGGVRTLVVGAGPIGVAALQFAILAGADATVLEINPDRRGFIRRQFDIPVLAEADGSTYDLVIDATGHPGAMEQSFHLVSHGGRLVFVGVIKARIGFDDALLHAREITLLASRNSLPADFPAIIGMIEQGRFDPAAWITHRLDLPDIPREFEPLPRQPSLVKAMIDVPDHMD
jgi:2-desacetyl-2-hydroxyethyl bacteriochlorophyllide A dehydrogenase